MVKKASKDEINKPMNQQHDVFEQLDLRSDQLVHLVTHCEAADMRF